MFYLLHNTAFKKGVEFDTFLHEAGANRFNMTPRKWIEATNTIGIVSKAGRKGGTYAHRHLHEMSQRQLSRLNAIDAEKGFRKIDHRKSIVSTKNLQ